MEEVIAATGLLNIQPATGEAPKQSTMYSGGIAESPDSEEYYHEEEASHTEEEDGFKDAQQDMYYHGIYLSSGSSTHLSSGSSTPHRNLQWSISFTNNNATPTLELVYISPGCRLV
jgi:hypothetical protein